MSNQTDHTIVRLRVPPELKQEIEESAEKNNRSQSAEMVSRLEQSFESTFHEDTINKIPTETLMMELSHRFKGFSIVMMESKDIKKAP